MKKKCFVIMPFTVKPDDLQKYHDYKNHWIEVYNGLIIPALDKAGLDYERDDEDFKSRLITESIWRKIENVDLVICDLSSGNPNVFLELGWALRSNKQFVLIKDDITTRYFDLNQYFTYEYPHLLQPTQITNAVKELSLVIENTLSDSDKSYSIFNKVLTKDQAIEETKKGNIEIQLLDQILSGIKQLNREKNFNGSNDLIEIFRKSNKIKTLEQLQKFLPTSTWRKANNFETITFLDEKSFMYKNYLTQVADKNFYSLGPEFGQMNILWGMDNFEAKSIFTDDFTKFIELYNPSYTWTLVG